ncbi:solute carrier family 2, facilitated glucose transporter member 5 isoform X4 [Elephas maximus indicus]|uniref:solute carrier family 2, facilitated glucose transporter member 5 isoform X4 n=1 Tax=Elephas maximus indicus TaxID=99487 RepID=UPI002115EFBC|nr:solute carrier family 2, facilitated glucose transporter member 5 isoform X4 [Elephas maximus indicus]
MVRMEDRADCPLRFASLHPAEHQGKSWHSANRQERLTLILALATLIAAFGSSFQYGYNVAVINSPAEIMKQFYNDTNYERYGEYIPEVSLTLLWSVSVSMFPFGGFLGSLLVGPLVTRLGRKGTLLFNNIFSIVPAILMGCSKVAGSFEMIILSRLLVGICAGLSSNVVPMYLGELAPKNLRGALGVVPQLFITVGIFVAQIFGLRSLLATEEGWPILLGLTGVPAALQLALLPFFPESPRYLLVQKKDETAAKNDLLLCGPDLPQRRREGGRGPVRDGRHRGRQRGDDHLCCVCGGAAGQKTADPPRLLHLPHSLLRADRRPGTTGPIPALLITEIFLQSSRPAAYMVGGSVHWLSNFTVGLVFPFIQVGLGAYSFIIFAVICLLTTIYTFLVVPETKAKTFIEINQIFTKINKVSEVYPEKEELTNLPPSTLGQ